MHLSMYAPMMHDVAYVYKFIHLPVLKVTYTNATLGMILVT